MASKVPAAALSPQPESKSWRQPWTLMDFSDTDSDTHSEDEVPKRCFKVLGVSPNVPYAVG